LSRLTDAVKRHVQPGPRAPPVVRSPTRRAAPPPARPGAAPARPRPAMLALDRLAAT